MDRSKKKETWVTVLLVAVFVLLVAAGVANRWDYSRRMLCKQVEVSVEDSAQVGFVTSAVALETLREAGFDRLVGEPMERLDIRALETAFRVNPWVSRADVYGCVDGTLRIRIEQRIPLLRVLGADGTNYYLDSLLCVMPACGHYFADVPVVSGMLSFGSVDVKSRRWVEKKDLNHGVYMKKLINFAKNVSNDDFLRNFIVQIYLTPNSEIELVPRVSNHVIRFGTLEKDPQSRLASLKAFYMNGASIDGFEKIKIVDVRYRNQVVVQ